MLHRLSLLRSLAFCLLLARGIPFVGAQAVAGTAPGGGFAFSDQMGAGVTFAQNIAAPGAGTVASAPATINGDP
jgi:hypothetical protein